MAERRPFPPSPRRRALARQAGLTAASPLVVGAVAACAAIATLAVFARAAVTRLGTWVAVACGSASTGVLDEHGDVHHPLAAPLAPRGVAGAVLELAVPIVAAAAIAAVLAHLAQTRGLWLPRRRIEAAPAAPRSPGRAALELAGPVVVGGVAFGWLWLAAPQLARLLELTPDGTGVEPAAALPLYSGSVNAPFAALRLAGGAVITLVTAWVVLGALDALVRHAELGSALAMTPAEKQQDDRLAAADPRWKARRAALARSSPAREAVARAAVVLVGDDVAVAIAWHPTRQPVPLVLAGGRGPRAMQLTAVARRQGLPIHRDATLAAALATVDGPVPDTHWPTLATIIAAVSSRTPT